MHANTVWLKGYLFSEFKSLITVIQRIYNNRTSVHFKMCKGLNQIENSTHILFSIVWVSRVDTTRTAWTSLAGGDLTTHPHPPPATFQFISLLSVLSEVKYQDIPFKLSSMHEDVCRFGIHYIRRAMSVMSALPSLAHNIDHSHDNKTTTCPWLWIAPLSF